MKKIYYSIFAVIVLSALFVLADYFALFGTKTNIKLDFAEGTFRTVDAETGDLVLQVIVRCIQKHNNKACTQRETNKANIVSVHLPMKRIVTESLLFKQSEKTEKPADPNIQIKFIHPNYGLPFVKFKVDDFYAGKLNEYVIKMNRIDWGEEAEDE